MAGKKLTISIKLFVKKSAGWVDEWVTECVEGLKDVLRIAYSNQKERKERKNETSIFTE